MSQSNLETLRAAYLDMVDVLIARYDIGAILPCCHARAIAEGNRVLERVHVEYWARFLPGADRWIHPSH